MLNKIICICKASAMAFAIGFFLTACTALGPDFHEPEVSWLADWESELYSRIEQEAGQAQVDIQVWWQLFDDPVLNRLVDIARLENPSLRIAGLRVLESRAALGIAGSGRYPQLQQATGALAYVNTQSSSGSDQSLGSYEAGLTAGWELDFWGRYSRSIESADAAFFASVFNQQNGQVLLIAQVADLYYAYRTILLRIDIANKNARIQKRSYEITEALFKSGENAELDLQQAKAQYMATLSSIPALEIGLAQIRNNLCVLLGRPPGNLPELDNEIKALPVVNPAALEEVPAQLLMRRPDIRASASQIAAQSAQVGIAETDLYPSISLFGNLGWSGSTPSETANTLSLGVGPSFKWNLFDHGRIKNNVRLQDARLQQTIENFQNVVLVAAREIDDAAISVIKTREQKSPQRESTLAAERSLELANTRYLEGYANFQRVLDAQRAAAAQAERELINDSNHISAVISLYRSLGGGWSETPVAELVPQSTRELMESRSDWGDLLQSGDSTVSER